MRFNTLSLALLATIPGFTFAVDVEVKGQSLKNALKSVGEAVGLDLQASGPVQNDVVYIRAKNADPNQLLEKITYATGYEWLKNGSTYTLTLTGNAKQKLITESNAVLQAQIDSAIDKRKESSPRSIDFNYINEVKVALERPNSYNSSENRIQLNSPLQDSIYWIWQSDKSSFLRSIPENTRVVYSTAPTNRQQRMTGTMRNAIEKGASGYRGILAEALKAFQNNQRIPISGLRDLRQVQATYDRAIAKANLAVSRRNGRFDFVLQYVDNQGQFIEQVTVGGLSLDEDIIPSTMQAYSWPKVTATEDINIAEISQAVLTRNRTIRYLDRSIDAKRLERANSIKNPIPYAPGINLDAGKALLNPDQVDPVGTLVNPFLDSEVSNLIVAIIPDEIAPRLAGALVTGDSAKFLASAKSVVRESQDGWLILRPANRLGSQESRFDRTALQAALLSLSKNYGMLSIQNLIDYTVKSNRSVPNSGIDVAIADYLFGQDSGNQLDRTHGEGWLDHMIFAQITANARINSLSQIASALLPLNDHFYNTSRFSGGMVQILTRPGQFQAQEVSREQLNQIRQNQANTPDERTDFIPIGISNSAPATHTFAEDDRVLAIDYSTGRKISYGANDFGQLLAMANFGGAPNYPASAEVFDEYLPIRAEVRTITVTLGNGQTMTASVSGFKSAGRVSTYDDLPSNFLSSVDRAYDRYDQQLSERLTRTGNNGRDSGRRGGRGGGRTIPPQ